MYAWIIHRCKPDLRIWLVISAESDGERALYKARPQQGNLYRLSNFIFQDVQVLRNSAKIVGAKISPSKTLTSTQPIYLINGGQGGEYHESMDVNFWSWTLIALDVDKAQEALSSLIFFTRKGRVI
jgi:hypothetical protein